MTTSTTPPSTTIRLSEPGALIVSIPALLGFVPARSLVVFCMDGPSGTRVGLVMRMDLPDPQIADPHCTAALSEQLSVLCAQRKAPAIVAVVVEDRATPGELPHHALLAAVRAACEAVGTALLDAHAVNRVGTGARWRSYPDGARSGVLADPQSSVASAAHVLAGRVIHAGREELDAMLRRDNANRVPELVAMVNAALDAALLARELTGQRAVREDLDAVLTALARVGNRDGLFDQEIARLGAAISDPLVRDACFGLALGEHADDAQHLWMQLCRTLPDPERAEAAVLVAFGCYVRGDGPLAGIALQLALTSLPGHRMATLLDTALSGGLPPESIRELAGTARDIAADLGLALGPFTPLR